MYKMTDIIQRNSVDLEFSNNKVHQKRFSNPNNFSKHVLFLLLPFENRKVIIQIYIEQNHRTFITHDIHTNLLLMLKFYRKR